jgi:hypothetical protein
VCAFQSCVTFKRARSTNSDTADLNAFPVSVLVSVGFSLYFVGVRSAARSESCRDPIDTEDFRLVTFWCATLRNDLVGINSEVSYQLDHAPTGSIHSNCPTSGTEAASRQFRRIFCAQSSAGLPPLTRYERQYSSMISEKPVLK